MALSIPSATALAQPIKTWPRKRSLNVVPPTTKVVRYAAGQGSDSHVTLQWCKGIPTKDTTTRIILPVSKPMCLTKEEVRGQKVEHEILLPPGSTSLKLIPGGVFDSQDLLTRGRFSYLNWDHRTPYTLHGQGDLTRQGQVSLKATTEGRLREEEALDALRILTDPTHCSALPHRSSSSEMCWSASQDGMGANIGGSFFYMGLAKTQQFSFSSDRYRYLYVYIFDQIFSRVKADHPSQAKDLFSGIKDPSENALFLLEATYGRRIYAIIESEFALQSYSNGIIGGLEWLIISAKLQQPQFLAKVRAHINIRLQTQAGSWLESNDYSQLQDTIDYYFRTSCSENPLSPLSYKVSDLDGTPVSLLTTVFLDSQHGLTSPKARVRLKEIKRGETATMAVAASHSEEIYGQIHLHLFHSCAHEIFIAGQSSQHSQALDNAPAGTISIASRENPLRLNPGKTQTFSSHEPDKYIDVDISSLDMLFQIEPVIHERLTSGDHALSSIPADPKRTLRQILLEDSMGTTVHCWHDTCQLELTVEITPL
ncbi:MAG: hypothetical protein ACK6BG_03545 [Cyanobacteriota bacterium]